MAHGTSLPSRADLLKLRNRNSELSNHGRRWLKDAAYDTGAACIGRWWGRGQVLLTNLAPTPGFKIRGEGKPLIGEEQAEKGLDSCRAGDGQLQGNNNGVVGGKLYGAV
jgi:hypothetical protein